MILAMNDLTPLALGTPDPVRNDMANEQKLQSELAQVKIDLTMALRSKKILQTQVDSQSPTLSNKNIHSTTCAFLNTIPPEIRIQIYEILLTNPLLSTYGAIEKDYGSGVNYELSPGILGTCKQIHIEALPVLYEHNTFFIQCEEGTLQEDSGCNCFYREHDHWCRHSWCPCSRHQCRLYQQGHLNLTPVTRFWNVGDVVNSFVTLDKLAAIRNIRHWKVVLDPYWNLESLCLAICESTPFSIEILILPHARWVQSIKEGNLGGFDALLKPLRRLRKVRRITFKVAGDDDISSGINREENSPDEEYLPTAAFQEELRLLVTGQTPVELVKLMYRQLLKYGQSFERHDLFKVKMGLSRQNDEIIEEFGPEMEKYHREEMRTPYPYKNHPVELSLQDAKQCIIGNETQLFKESRKRVLLFLESQYQEVLSARADVIVFIGKEKLECGLFSARFRVGYNYHCHHEHDISTRMSTGFLLLKDYAATYQRHLPFDNRALFNRYQRKLENIYNSMDRERYISQMHDTFEDEHTKNFVELFKAAFDDMEKQYKNIRTARRALFDEDVEEDLALGDGFGHEMVGCENRVDWKITESTSHPQSLSW